MPLSGLCLCHLCRELEARVGATPPPSPSDRTDSAILTSRITQLSKEVKSLRKRLAEVEAKSEILCCLFMFVCMFVLVCV